MVGIGWYGYGSGREEGGDEDGGMHVDVDVRN